VDEPAHTLDQAFFNSGGNVHGKTVISAFGARETTSTEVWCGEAGLLSGSTKIGVRQL